MNYSIQKGNCSVSVLKIQHCLNELDPELNLDEDGIFGSKTEHAVRKFQKSHGLEEDGIIHSLTWDKIILLIKTQKKPENIILHAQSALSVGSRGLDVLKAQEYLNQVDGDHPLDTSGIFDVKTQVSVIRFQNRAGLNPDGRIGLETWDKLIEAL